MFKILYYVAYIVLYPFYRYRFLGRENLPKGPCVLCANHTANSDVIFLVLANGPKWDVGIIGKEELFRFKPFGAVLKWLGAFPVKRGSSDLQAVKTGFSILKAGKKLLIFPEGTRVKPGMKREPKPGAAMFALRNNVPMVPVYIPAGRKVFRRNTVVIGKPYAPTVDGKPDARVYLEVTEELMKRIFALKELSL